MDGKEITIGDRRSLERPAWTSEDLYAFNHKHTQRGIVENYYVKTKGKQ